MSHSGVYELYLARHGGIRSARKRLDREEFDRLNEEYEHLLRRMDPADIQLDEWKRLDELQFLLVLDPADDD